VNLKTKALQALMHKVMEEHIAFNKLLGLKVDSFDADAPRLRFDMRPELVGNPPATQMLHRTHAGRLGPRTIHRRLGTRLEHQHSDASATKFERDCETGRTTAGDHDIDASGMHHETSSTLPCGYNSGTVAKD